MKTTSYLKRRGIDPEDFSQELAIVAIENPDLPEAQQRTRALRNCLRLISGGKRSRVPSEALPDMRDTPPAVAEDSPELYEVWAEMPFRDLVASAMEHEENTLPPVVKTACKRHLERQAVKPRSGEWTLRAKIWYALTYGALLDHVRSGRPKPQYMPRAEVIADRNLAPITSRDLIERLTQWKPQTTAPASWAQS
jgi:hypothetical protein